MKNSIFDIAFDHASGTISSLKLVQDADHMNWCAEAGKWGYIHCINYDNIWGEYWNRQKEMKLTDFMEDEYSARSVYSNGILEVTVERRFQEDGNLVERFLFRNLVYADLFLSEHNCSIEVPFRDSYTYADDCLVHCCNTHIWCGLNTTYVNALKMGISNLNMGLVVTQGSFNSYRVLDAGLNSSRGRFLLNLAPVELAQNEEYAVEWVIFPHSGKADFFRKALAFPGFIHLQANHQTLFLGEKFCLTAETGEKPERVKIYDASGAYPFRIEGNTVIADRLPEDLGEHRIYVQINGAVTYTDYLVKEDFETLLYQRIQFIVDHQQYHKPGSPLDGAFLIYDNQEGHLIFEEMIPDHNANRERLGMSLLLARYLQTHENEKFRSALMQNIAYIKREVYNEKTGYVYDGLGRDESKVRLYNAPWVSMLFTEMYRLTGDTSYLNEITKLFEKYYQMGGAKFYPNGISIRNTLQAFETVGMKEAYEKLKEAFRIHVQNMVSNHTSYPKHEVNYEQTIVSPAATFLSEYALISGEEVYRTEAKTHIEILERFNGSQPSFHLNEIPIRYWDDYWFGKLMIKGDTFPHYWSCLTARSYQDYYLLTGEERYRAAAEECMRNCLCLFMDDGSASCAYLYPERIGDRYGKAYDPWANDQDFALYFAMETGLFTKT